MTRNGKTTTKYQYSRSWSLLESKSDLCPRCGKPGYIKYYYLGLNDKVKNWFRNEAMCKKNAITLAGKRSLAWENFELASEKRNLG